MNSALTLDEFLASLSPEDRDKAIAVMYGLIPPSPIGIMTRTTLKISSLGSPEEIRQRIADATGWPFESISIDDIVKQKAHERNNWLSVEEITQPYKEFLQSQPKTTADKYEELIDLGRFIIDGGLDLKIVVPDSPFIYPDFLLAKEDDVIGIEHTRLINPQSKAIIKSVSQVLEKVRIGLMAQYPDLHGSVNVYIDYKQPVIGKSNFQNRQFTAHEKKEIINLISAYVYAKIMGLKADKPAFIGDVSYLPNPEPRLDINLGETYIAKDGFEDLLLQRIAAKEKRFSTYISSASIEKCWLLIVIDGVSSYSGFDLQTVQFPIIEQSNFDAIILLEAISHKVIWLHRDN